MNGLTPVSEAALAPVRQALRASAESQVAEFRNGALQEVSAILASAQAEAAQIVTNAAAAGAASARTEAALRSSRVRREAHELLLARQSSVIEELRHQLAGTASKLQSDPRYPELLARLRENCQDLLGPEVSVSSSSDGGIIAVAGSRRLDLSLPVLAEMTLDSLPEARELWNR
ncbi:V-type ATP synthase subunit E family protein [Arthrobacter psychrochitiniphilus]|uniref:V-type ATP synthase subunit E family protein n=1 Tax=Arthrobacter psychrochitiniphilus TaxID=291045 RepID=UPI003F7CB3D2